MGTIIVKPAKYDKTILLLTCFLKLPLNFFKSSPVQQVNDNWNGQSGHSKEHCRVEERHYLLAVSRRKVRYAPRASLSGFDVSHSIK